MIKPDRSKFPPRQGSGVIQTSKDEILIFGGFAGKFIKYVYSLNPNTETVVQTPNLPHEMFPYQTPTLYDFQKKVLLTIDWQTLKLFSYSNGSWSSMCNLKAS
jgi:hypothetical protein